MIKPNEERNFLLIKVKNCTLLAKKSLRHDLEKQNVKLKIDTMFPAGKQQFSSDARDFFHIFIHQGLEKRKHRSLPHSPPKAFQTYQRKHFFVWRN